MPLKETIKKNSVALALFGTLTAGFGTATQYLKNENQKLCERNDRNEIFFSNYQDDVQCKFDSLKIKNCK